MKINYIQSRPINFYHPAILFFIILTSYYDCLAKWSLISPIPMGHDLKKVYFIDSVIG
jgi:hypothetical protein